MSSTAGRTLVGVTAALMIAAPASQAMPLDPGGMHRSAQTGRLPPSTPSGGDLRSQLGTSSLAGTTSPRPTVREIADALARYGFTPEQALHIARNNNGGKSGDFGAMAGGGNECNAAQVTRAHRGL